MGKLEVLMNVMKRIDHRSQQPFVSMEIHTLVHGRFGSGQSVHKPIRYYIQAVKNIRINNIMGLTGRLVPGTNTLEASLRKARCPLTVLVHTASREWR